MLIRYNSDCAKSTAQEYPAEGGGLLIALAPLPGRHAGQRMEPLSRLGFDALKELVAGYAQTQRQTGKDRNAKVPFARFDIAQRFPVNVGQLCQPLLAEIGRVPGLSDVGSDQASNLVICHPLLWSTFTPCLTPQIYSITS